MNNTAENGNQAEKPAFAAAGLVFAEDTSRIRPEGSRRSAAREYESSVYSGRNSAEKRSREFAEYLLDIGVRI